jgi:uncharacterized SAM-binding protein YcdF (DUF218 family)
VIGVVALAALGLFWVLLNNGHEATMRAAGEFLWVREELAAADVIYVLGGDYERRIPLAAKLYHRGIAPKIVIPRENMGPDLGEREHFTDVSLRLLQEAGVPSAALFDWKVGSGVGSTADEMKALALYVKLFPAVRRIIIVTSDYHTRRALYTANRLLPAGASAQVAGAENGRWRMELWWMSGVGKEAVFEEYKKLAYYVPRYFFAPILAYSLS